MDSYLIDDLDGSRPARPVRFGLHGTEYELDLADHHVQELEDDLARWLTAARRVGRGGRTSRRSVNRHAYLQAARHWLRDHGHDIGDRGRIPKELLDQFAAAQRDGSHSTDALE